MLNEITFQYIAIFLTVSPIVSMHLPYSYTIKVVDKKRRGCWVIFKKTDTCTK